ncbi:MAG: DnaA regulatory inactivator Hda [Pseudomonadota bacterium]|nr:DnaA regulatory inactivator Hda [Pseudomonadota bacterium]
MAQQLILPLQLDDSASFENYYSGPNSEAVEELKLLVDSGNRRRPVYLWGKPGCGRTHLLHALCQRAEGRGRLHLYLPLGSAEFTPSVFERLNPALMVCLDNLEAIAGDEDWEQAILSLFDKIAGGTGALVVTAQAPPPKLGFALPDLASRLASGGVYRLLPLDDRGKAAFLRLRARERGLDLSDEVVKYILRHYRRDTESLFSLLDRIDTASLSARRRVTVPFIKQYLSSVAGSR